MSQQKLKNCVSNSCSVIILRFLCTSWCCRCVRGGVGVFSFFLFLSLQFSHTVSFRACSDVWKISLKRFLYQRPSIFVRATNQEGKGGKNRKVARGQSESQINQIFGHPKPSRVKLNFPWLRGLEYLIDLTFTLSSGNFSFFTLSFLVCGTQKLKVFDLMRVLSLFFNNRSKRWRTLFVKLAEEGEKNGKHTHATQNAPPMPIYAK